MTTAESPDKPSQPRYPDDLVIVTHRGPASLSQGEAGGLVIGQAAGGLAPSLTRALRGSSTQWIACATTPLEREVGEGCNGREIVPGIDVHYLVLDEQVVSDAYQRVANETMWFIYHEMAQTVEVRFDEDWLRAFANFRAYNRAFATEIMSVAAEGATVMVNDYHLPLVGALLLRERPDLKTVHFSHTPFCRPEHLALLPEQIARELLSSMCSFGACGFHTTRWADAFRACCAHYGVPTPELFSCGLGVDASALEVEGATPPVLSYAAKDARRFAGRKVIFRSDRLEPTKNIVNGFLAYGQLLEHHPELASTTVFFARSYLSRTDLLYYRNYRDEVERVVELINSRFGAGVDPPIVFEIDDEYDASLAAYRLYDVLVVNPILDGMNLVAKEAPVVNQNDGAVVLSRGAGAFELLHGSVIGVDPLDIEATATALERALSMPMALRRARAAELKVLAAVNAPAIWLSRCMSHAQPAGA